MAEEKIINIDHKRKTYKLECEKVLFILSILENKKTDSLNNGKILKLLKKYGLFDEIFLKNINKIR